MAKQIKSKQRVAEHGEVFTAEREVNAMLDLVKPECLRPDSRFLEPACGDGNFLSAILERKLKEIRRKYKSSVRDYEYYSVIAVGSLYGVDIMQDNVEICRQRLFKIWDKQYKSVCKSDCSEEMRDAIRFIIARNIVCGNALTLMCVDDKGNDTDVPIVFSEWSPVMKPKISYVFNKQDKHNASYFFQNVVTDKCLSVAKLIIIFDIQAIISCKLYPLWLKNVLFRYLYNWYVPQAVATGA